MTCKRDIAPDSHRYLHLIPGTRDNYAGVVCWSGCRSPLDKTGFLHFLSFRYIPKKGFLLFPSFIEFKYPLFHRICRFMVFPVLFHAFAYVEKTRLFAVPCPHTIFRFIDTENNPAVQAFCKHPARFGYWWYHGTSSSGYLFGWNNKVWQGTGA